MTWQTPTCIHGKVLKNARIEGTYLNIIKALSEKSTAKVILGGEKLGAIPLASGMRQECALLWILFNTVLSALARAVKQEEEIKGLQTGEEVKLSIPIAGKMILNFKIPQENLQKQ